MKFFSLVLTLSLMFQTVLASNTTDISRYGAQGDLTPQIMGQPMPESFFSTPRLRAMSNGQSYVGRVSVPRDQRSDTIDLGRGVRVVSAADKLLSNASDLQLILVNEHDDTQDIVLSAVTNNGDVTNFIIRLEGASDAILDVSSLSKSSDFYIISSRSAQAWLSYDGQTQDVEWTEPTIDSFENITQDHSASKAVDYCHEAGRWKRLKAVANGGIVVAYFKRVFAGTNSESGRNFYKLEVHYPNIGDVFHRPTGSGYTINDQTCTMTRYITKSSSNVSNSWSEMDPAIFTYSGEAYGCVVPSSTSVQCYEVDADWEVLKHPDF